VNSKLSRCWNAIVQGNYDKKDRFWTLNDGATWLGGIKIFYNRVVYDELIETLKLRQYPTYTTTLCLIYGTPGIGKTVFLSAVLVAIVENARMKNIPLPSIHYVRRSWKTSETWCLLPDGTVVEWDKLNEPDYLLSV